MGWSIGEFNGRDIGYGVPAVCDCPKCKENIDRGLSYVCGGDVYGGDKGCGLFFCFSHLAGDNNLCPRCRYKRAPYTPKGDTAEWIRHKLTDESWQAWRDENAELVRVLEQALGDHDSQIITATKEKQ